jgi:hypothetical protein
MCICFHFNSKSNLVFIYLCEIATLAILEPKPGSRPIPNPTADGSDQLIASTRQPSESVYTDHVVVVGRYGKSKKGEIKER